MSAVIRSLFFPGEETPVTADPAKQLPERDKIAALQLAIIDNWPGGKRQPFKSYRYGLSVQAWVGDTAKVTFKRGSWDMKFIGDFMTATELEDRLATKLTKIRYPLSARYLEVLKQLIADNPDHLFAIFEQKRAGDGTLFPDFHVIHIESDPAVKSLSVIRSWLLTGKDYIPLPAFSPLASDGKPLGSRDNPKVNEKTGRINGQPVLQCRFSDHPRFHNPFATTKTIWVTG